MSYANGQTHTCGVVVHMQARDMHACMLELEFARDEAQQEQEHEQEQWWW